AAEIVDWWVVDPRPDGSRPRRGPTADSVEGLLELVAAGAGVNIAGASASRHYRRDDLAYVRIDDIEPATIVLCTRVDARNPMVTTSREPAQPLPPRRPPPATGPPVQPAAASAPARGARHSSRRRACSSGSGTGEAAMRTRVYGFCGLR